MKYLVVIFLFCFIIFLSSCSTPISVKEAGPHLYIVCDNGPQFCNGTNPEKGIERVCLPHNEAIYRIYNEGRIPGQGIEVECGPEVK